MALAIAPNLSILPSLAKNFPDFSPNVTNPFTFSATKLPSYWLPATPAAALLIGLASVREKKNSIGFSFALIGSILFSVVLALALFH